MNAKQEVFETNYRILRSMLISTILTCLGYDKKDAKRIRKKNTSSYINDLDSIFECSPLFDDNAIYKNYSKTFLKIFVSKSMIYLYQNMDDIIQTMLNNQEKPHKYPTDEVLKIFNTSSNFIESALNGRENWFKVFMKLNKMMNLLEHNFVDGFSDYYYKILSFCRKYNDYRIIFDIMDFGTMLCFNTHIQDSSKNKIQKYLSEFKIKEAMKVFNEYLNTIPYNMSYLYQSYMESNPFVYNIFQQEPSLADAAGVFDYVSFVINDEYVSRYINKILFK